MIYDLDRRLDALQATLADLGVIVEPHVIDLFARRIQAAVEAGEDRDFAVRRGALQLLADLSEHPSPLMIARGGPVRAA